MESTSNEPPAGRPRIVILGGGFGGAYAAMYLERALRPDEAEILLIDRNNYFVFTPLLVEAGVGGLEPRHTVVSLRRFARRSRFRMAEVRGIDLARRIVRIQPPDPPQELEIPYDHLVLAMGSVTLLPPIPGLREFGYEMKSLRDAVALRDRMIRMLEVADGIDDPAERAARLHLVVVGANFSGVEVAGEFHAFMREASRRYPNVHPRECNVTLVELKERILQALDPDLARFAARNLMQRSIRVLLRTTVAEVHADHVLLSNGERLAAHTVIWCAGITSNPTLAGVEGLPRDARGFVLCEPDLRACGLPDVWGIGDCAVNPDPQGNAYPATAQHAVQQARVLARNLRRVLRGQPTEPCRIRNRGSLAALGCRTGVARIGPLKLSGWAAWFMWRTVYLLKMPGLARGVRIALDWTLDLFFRREYSALGLHQRPSPPAPNDSDP